MIPEDGYRFPDRIMSQIKKIPPEGGRKRIHDVPAKLC